MSNSTGWSTVRGQLCGPIDRSGHSVQLSGDADGKVRRDACLLVKSPSHSSNRPVHKTTLTGSVASVNLERSHLERSHLRLTGLLRSGPPTMTKEHERVALTTLRAGEVGARDVVRVRGRLAHESSPRLWAGPGRS